MLKLFTCCVLAGSSIAFGATLAHDYNLTSSLNDLVGSDNLTADGGTLSSAGYAFGPNQGLNVSNALVGDGDYSLVLDFSFSDLAGYRKIVDFADKGSDAGLYNLNASLNFFPVATGPTPTFVADTPLRVELTRDGATGNVAGYVDGVAQFTFTDTVPFATFSAPNELMRFFEDDNVTGQREASGGVATRISIYDGALTAAEIAALGGPSLPVGSVPEPASLALLGAGLLGLAVVRKRAR